MNKTILWYDIETFGRSPYWDRVAQFACVRTDDRFEVVEDPKVIYCRITEDYVPDPGACLITGITPQETLEKGLSEYEFIKAVDAELSRPGTCVTGYNNIRFDDEFIRNLYYRNFFDPYGREWKNGNSRWDIIDLVRVTRDLRPEGIIWPEDSEGKPQFKLEQLSKANGLEHAHAHDALSDVFATIGMARLIHDKQPKLFQWVFRHRTKDSLRPFINLETKEPFLHTSGMFTRKEGCTTLVMPLTVDPKNRNCVLAYDLRFDPSDLVCLDAASVRERIFTPADELPEGEGRISVKGIHINKCPVVAPVSTLDGNSEKRLGLDLEKCREHYRILRANPSVVPKLREVFEVSPEFTNIEDPDMKLYSGGFFRDEDSEVFRAIHIMPPEELCRFRPHAYDPRIPEMFRRFLGRNFFNRLDEKEQKKWISFCAGRILMPPHPDMLDIGTFRKKIEALKNNTELSAGERTVVKALSDYQEYLENHILK